MIYQRVENIFIVRLDVGEEILSSLTELCSQEKITAGTISGIGAANYADIGLYEVAKRKYHGTILEEEMEIASLNGNISRKEGKVYLHLHAAFANKQGQIFGGHLRSARISATAEIYIHTVPAKIERVFDEETTGLNLIQFDPTN